MTRYARIVSWHDSAQETYSDISDTLKDFFADFWIKKLYICHIWHPKKEIYPDISDTLKKSSFSEVFSQKGKKGNLYTRYTREYLEILDTLKGKETREKRERIWFLDTITRADPLRDLRVPKNRHFRQS